MTPVIQEEDDNSTLSRLLSALRCQITVWKTKLYQNYAHLLLYYIGLQIPFEVPLLDLSFTPMSSKRRETPNGETFFSAKEELDATSPLRQVSEDSFDAALRQHSTRQDDITNNMLEMARMLKARTVEANNLIKRDIKKLDEAKTAVEGNVAALNSTSVKLDSCSKSGMNWCLIILLIAVLIIFINMVLLMKVAKKS